MMALTNIELYEALKRDLNDDAARLIAEVVPKADDLATKADLLLMKADLLATTADLELKLADVELRIDRRITALERRFFAIFAVPLWGATIVAVTKYVFET